MAVIQPYFDPTPARTSGVFGAFLESFVAERSATNRAIMQQYLSRMSPKDLREQQAIIMRTISNLEDKKAGIVRDAARGKSQERQALLKGYLQVQVAQINARSGMQKVMFKSKSDLARTLLDNQAKAQSELSKATTFEPSNELLSQVSSGGGQGVAQKFNEIANEIQKIQGFKSGALGDKAKKIAVLRVVEQRLGVDGIRGPQKAQAEKLKAYTLNELGARDTKEAMDDFRDNNNLNMQSNDIRDAVDQIAPEAFGTGGVSIQNLTSILNQAGVSTQAPTQSVDDAIKKQWKEYNKIQTKIDEIATKGATAMYEPFQWNYMLENLNTKEHRNQMLLDSVVEVGAPFGERTEMVRTTPEQIPDEPELLEESRAAQEDRERDILAGFEAQRQVPQEPVKTRAIGMDLDEPTPAPAPARRQPRAKVKRSTRRPAQFREKILEAESAPKTDVNTFVNPAELGESLLGSEDLGGTPLSIDPQIIDKSLGAPKYAKDITLLLVGVDDAENTQEAKFFLETASKMLMDEDNFSLRNQHPEIMEYIERKIEEADELRLKEIDSELNSIDRGRE